MSGMLRLYFVPTSPRTDYLFSLVATILTAGVTGWAVLETGWTWASTALLGLTVVPVGTTGYARSQWRKAQPKTVADRARAVKIRAARRPVPRRVI